MSRGSSSYQIWTEDGPKTIKVPNAKRDRIRQVVEARAALPKQGEVEGPTYRDRVVVTTGDRKWTYYAPSSYEGRTKEETQAFRDRYLDRYDTPSVHLTTSRFVTDLDDEDYRFFASSDEEPNGIPKHARSKVMRQGGNTRRVTVSYNGDMDADRVQAQVLGARHNPTGVDREVHAAGIFSPLWTTLEEDITHRESIAEFVEGFVLALKPDYQKMLVEAFGHGMSHESIARAHGQPRRTITDNIRTAMRALIREMALADAAFVEDEKSHKRGRGRPARDYEAEFEAASRVLLRFKASLTEAA